MNTLKTKSSQVLFLQEMHSCEEEEKKCNGDFKEILFFLHGTTNSCEVAIGYSVKKQPPFNSWLYNRWTTFCIGKYI